MGPDVPAARGSVHLPRDHPAVVRPQPALPLVQARADVSGRPRSRGHLLRRGGRRRHEPAPLPLRRRPRRPRAQRAPAAVPAHALLARRARAAGARAAHRGDDRLRVDLRADPVAARRPLRAAGDARARGRDRRRPPHPARGPRRARHRHLLAGQPLRQHRPRRGRHPLLVRLRLVPARGRDARDRPPVREPLVRDRGRVRPARRRLADDGRRSAPLGDHRLRAAHDRLLDLARGAGVLDADRRAHARTGSSSRRATWMSDRETVDFLATVPLLEGREEADLVGAGAGDAPADGAGGRGPLAPGGRRAGDGVHRRRRRLGVAARARRSHGGDRRGPARGDGRRDRAARRRAGTR